MAKQVNNELDPQMAVDILNNDDKKLGVQDSEQQARGKRSPFLASLNTRHNIRIFSDWIAFLCLRDASTSCGTSC